MIFDSFFGYHFVDPDMRFFGKGPGSPEIGCSSSINLPILVEKQRKNHGKYSV